MSEIKYSAKEDLKLIARCHRSAFRDSLSSKMGIQYLSKMLEWYISDKKKFLFHIEEEKKCIGYCGGMIVDGTQLMGSTSGMMQHSLNEAFFAFLLRPWLVFHPEFKEKSGLIKKNIKSKFKKKLKADTEIGNSTRSFRQHKSLPLLQNESNEKPYETETGLVVIGVDPEYQGKGYGTMLLKEFEKKTNQLNIKKMGLAVEANNKSAIRSYERNGWKIERQKDDYFEMIKYL